MILAVVQVELQADVRAADSIQHLHPARQRRKRITGHVPAVQRLDHDPRAETAASSATQWTFRT